MGGKKTGGVEFDLDKALKVAKKVSLDLELAGIPHEIAGSIRRKKERVHDVDIVVMWTEEAQKWCTEKFGTLKNGKPRRQGLFKVNETEMNVEIYPATKESWVAALMTWTGSVEHNIRQRAAAKRMGCKFSQNGFVNDSDLVVHFDSEKQLFDYLGEPYLAPEERG